METLEESFVILDNLLARELNYFRNMNSNYSVLFAEKTAFRNKF